MPGEAYRITLPDGTTVADGTLDEKGHARVSNIDPRKLSGHLPESGSRFLGASIDGGITQCRQGDCIPPLATGNGAPDEIISAEVRPKLADEARRIWGVENNIYQFGHRGYVAVKGGAQDCPYTYMRDLMAGTYRLPWEDQVQVTDGSSCGFAIPNRTYEG